MHQPHRRTGNRTVAWRPVAGQGRTLGGCVGPRGFPAVARRGNHPAPGSRRSPGPVARARGRAASATRAPNGYILVHTKIEIEMQ